MKAWIAFWNGGSASEGKGVLQIAGIAVSLIVGLSRLEAHELWRSWQLTWDQRLWRWSYPRPYGSAEDQQRMGKSGNPEALHQILAPVTHPARIITIHKSCETATNNHYPLQASNTMQSLSQYRSRRKRNRNHSGPLVFPPQRHNAVASNEGVHNT